MRAGGAVTESRNDRILASALVPATPAVTWALLSDTRLWPTWGVSVTAVEGEGEVVYEGMRGRIRTPLGIWLPFEITEVAPGRAWSWQVAGIRATGHEVHPGNGPGESSVCITGHPILLPYGIVCDVSLRRLARVARSVASAIS